MNKLLIYNRLQEIKTENPKASAFRCYLILIVDILVAIYRILLGKFLFRNIKHLGKMVSVNGFPKLNIRGETIIGNHVRIWSAIEKSKIFVKSGAKLKVGDNTRINGAHISVSQEVIIGNNVRISPYVLIMDDDFHDIKQHFAEGKKAKIVIEDNVWLASKCSVLKGVTIGEGAVVATGAVVTKDVAPFTLVAGIPAKMIKKIS